METSGPYQIFDFVQVQVHVQVMSATVENLRPHLLAETTRIREKLKLRDPADVRKAMVVVDASSESQSDPRVRQLRADWMKENEDLLRVVTGGVAFVLPNPMLRGALTAILWAAPLPIPITVHESLDLAIDHAIGEVERNSWGDISNELLMGGAIGIQQRLAEAQHALAAKAC